MQTDETPNLIKFKSQMLKAYIMGMFPKSFCRISISDYTNPVVSRWSRPNEPYIVLNVKYLHKLFCDSYTIKKECLDTEMDEYVSDRLSIKIKDITRLVTFRNEVVNMFGLPSKLTLRSYPLDILSINRQDYNIDIAPSSIKFRLTLAAQSRTIWRNRSLAGALRIRVKSFKLSESYKISESEKIEIRNYYKAFASLPNLVDVSIDAAVKKLGIELNKTIDDLFQAEN